MIRTVQTDKRLNSWCYHVSNTRFSYWKNEGWQWLKELEQRKGSRETDIVTFSLNGNKMETPSEGEVFIKLVTNFHPYMYACKMLNCLIAQLACTDDHDCQCN